VEIEAEEFLEAFESLMAAGQKRGYVLCLRMLEKRDDGDEATHDAFLMECGVLLPHSMRSA
jgi:DNA-directed RNA polymerase specialized sigma24 family protein